jgi:hypothetical protein
MYGCIAAGGCCIPPNFLAAQASTSPEHRLHLPQSCSDVSATVANAETSEDSHLPIIASRRLADGVDYELLMAAKSLTAEVAFCTIASLANATDGSAAATTFRAAVLCATLR